MATCTRIVVLTLSTALLAGPVSAQGFEGFVSYKSYNDNGKTGEWTMAMKGSMMRTDMSADGHQMAMIMDMDARKMTMLMPEQKMYMSNDMSTMADRMKNDDAPPKITALGTSETIAGRTCENFQVTSSDKKSVVLCNAKGLGNFMMPKSPMGRGPSGSGNLNAEIFRQYFKDGFFPLKVTDADSKRVVMEVTKIDPKPVDASLFQVPAGYNEMKMPGMGRP